MFSFKAFTPRLVVLHSMRRRGRVCRKAASDALCAAKRDEVSRITITFFEKCAIWGIAIGARQW
jgi:hypothetical protein